MNYAYEADVTRYVSGNGSYGLSGFASGMTNGSDPWTVGSTPPDLEGASLVVIYTNGQIPKTTIQLALGAAETQNGALLTENFANLGPNGSRVGHTTFIVADGQGLGSVGIFVGDPLVSDFLGADPQSRPKYSEGNLWDTETFDVSNLLNDGLPTAPANVQGFGDCLVWVGQVLSVTQSTGVAPDLGLYCFIVAQQSLNSITNTYFPETPQVTFNNPICNFLDVSEGDADAYVPAYVLHYRYVGTWNGACETAYGEWSFANRQPNGGVICELASISYYIWVQQNLSTAPLL